MLWMMWSGWALADCSLTEELLLQASTATDLTPPLAGEVHHLHPAGGRVVPPTQSEVADHEHGGEIGLEDVREILPTVGRLDLVPYFEEQP